MIIYIYIHRQALCVARKVQMAFKHVRCNPDVAPGLTSGGYDDKVNVITPINILFIGGCEFESLMKIKLTLLPHATLFIRGGNI